MKKIFKKHRTFWTLFLLSFLCACNSDVYQLHGFWAIDDIKYKGVDVKTNLSFNTIDFDENGTCDLPQVNWQGAMKGKWEIQKHSNSSYVVIESTRSIFNGKYSFYFYKDSLSKLFTVHLTSDSVDMICTKFFQNFEEAEFINDCKKELIVVQNAKNRHKVIIDGKEVDSFFISHSKDRLIPILINDSFYYYKALRQKQRDKIK